MTQKSQKGQNNFDFCLQLKRKTYPLLVSFYITRKILDDLGRTDGLSPEQVDTLVSNALFKKLRESETDTKGGE